MGNPQSLGSNPDTAAVKGCHGNLEALAQSAQEVFLRNLDVVEDQFSRSGGTDPQFVVMIAEGKTGHAFFEDKGTDAARTCVGIGDSKDNVRISFAAVGNENLVAVENPVLAIKDSRCFCAACVRTGIGFCKAKGTDLLTFGKGNEVFLLLFFCPKGKDRIGTQGYVSRKDNANTAVNTGQFLYGNGIGNVIHAGPAVFFRIGKSHPAIFAHFLDDFSGELAFLIEGECNRLDFRFSESAYCSA